ncbi:hypothetical protein ACJJTC_007993 [Scirpophaga incertulas]
MFLMGLCIHIIFLFSIFDIYFKSPIVRNVNPYHPQHEALADRVVLFVVDGLRAESFVNHTTMPYLRFVANSIGRWGISNTRMPTESRPGHVAVIAGFYEDPSAVMKGWKENPVDFDSVFNQSSYTWCWGAYDIIEIFTKGNTDDHIFSYKFDPYDQSFSTNRNTTLLDAWVFNNVKDFFLNAVTNSVLNDKLHRPKIIFFLHLLGTDTSGHTHKPRTENFLTTLKFVDEGIKEIEKLITDFYEDDGRTTFIMTSDHGMTDWGSHGAGLKHETETPYVMWGSGVQKVQVHNEKLDRFTLGMSLHHRFDINQADLAPLMSSLLSIPVPVNSVGRVPLEILNMTLANKAKALYSNSRQLASQYDKKRQDIEDNALSILYKPYEPFSKQKYEDIIQFSDTVLTHDDLESEKYEKIMSLSRDIMDLSLAGLDYYHNYYQTPLLILVILAFIAWIMCLLKLLLHQKMVSQINSCDINIKQEDKNHTKFLSFANIPFLLMISFLIILITVQNLPLQFYIYALLPLYLWRSVLLEYTNWIQTVKHLIKNKEMWGVFVEGLNYTIGAITLGMSFTHRWMLSVPLLGMGLWPFFSSSRNHITNRLLILWSIGCVLLSLFSFVPVVGKDAQIEFVVTAGLIWIVILCLYTWKVLLPLFLKQKESMKEITLTIVQIILLGLSLHNIYVQSMRFDKGTQVSALYQGLAWIIAVSTLLMPLACSKRLICRLMAIFTSILNFYLLLSVAHEGLFIVTLSINVMCWLVIEYKMLHIGNLQMLDYTFDKTEVSERSINFERSISRQDFRRAFFFTTYIILAFFGTGNIASLNSFEVRWVTCFITSFRPFIITGLILLKTLSPFLTVACSFRAIQHFTKAPADYLHIIVLIYSNIMGMQLLFNVKNYGSWLDIGTSISQFVIVQVITLFIVLINQIAKMLTNFSIILFINSLLGKSIKKYV